MPAVSALQEQLHFHDGDCITQHSLSKAQFWCRYKKIAHESLPVLNLKAQAETFMANSEFQRKQKIHTMCLERTIMYLALFVVSGYFMKHWTWRCKKFSCTSLKNIFLLPQFVPTYFLLQNALCSGQSSSWEHAEWLGSIPGVSREHLEMALQALVWVKRWEALPVGFNGFGGFLQPQSMLMFLTFVSE